MPIRLSLETGSANSVARGTYTALGYVEEQVTLTKELAGDAASGPTV